MYPGAHDPDRPATIMAMSGEVTTFGELDAAANRISRVFREAGLGPGDHVALVVENCAAFMQLLWGALYAGLYYTAISTRLNADELAYIIDDCGAEVLVLSARYADRAAGLATATPKVTTRLSVGGVVDGYEPLEAAMAAQPSEPLHEHRTAGRDMLYSSGTTGRPKGIRPREISEPLDGPHTITPVLQGLLGVSDASVYLSPAPTYHAAPLRFCLSAQQIGATVVMMERFDAQLALDLIRDHRVTHTQMVPTMFVRMLKADPKVRETADLSTLKAVIHAGAPCPPDVKRAMIEWLGPIVCEYYGSTEGSGMTWVTSEQWLEHEGTVGAAVIGRPRIVAEDDGRELAPGETGLVFFSDGPQFDYHNDPDKTAAAHNADGWSHFGDIGHVDADGYLYLTDRASFTIITGGVNVYPQEAEDVLISHPKVMDAAVFGVPNEDFGEEVKAVVQPVEEPADPEALAAELIAHCRSKLADVKCPRSVDFRAELPRHDTGKLYKRLLKDEYA